MKNVVAQTALLCYIGFVNRFPESIFKKTVGFVRSF
jgi:hypothetical protein